MNTLRVALISLGLLMASSAMAQDKLRVLDQGLDGDQRTYLITCPGGGLGSVVQHWEIDSATADKMSKEVKLALTSTSVSRPPKLIKTCVFPHEGKERCRANWKLDAAAKASCK